MTSATPGEGFGKTSPVVCYVYLADHEAALAAKDAELESVQRELADAKKNAFNLSSLIEGIARMLGIVHDPFEPASDEIAERLAMRGSGWDIEGMGDLIADELGDRENRIAAKDAAIRDLLAIIDDADSLLVLQFCRDYGKPFDAGPRIAEIRAGLSDSPSKDAAIRECVAAMRRAHECLSIPRKDRYPADEMVARDWLADMIAKHAPKEANDA